MRALGGHDAQEYETKAAHVKNVSANMIVLLATCQDVTPPEGSRGTSQQSEGNRSILQNFSVAKRAA